MATVKMKVNGNVTVTVETPGGIHLGDYKGGEQFEVYYRNAQAHSVVWINPNTGLKIDNIPPVEFIDPFGEWGGDFSVVPNLRRKWNDKAESWGVDITAAMCDATPIDQSETPPFTFKVSTVSAADPEPEPEPEPTPLSVKISATGKVKLIGTDKNGTTIKTGNAGEDMELTWTSDSDYQQFWVAPLEQGSTIVSSTTLKYYEHNGGAEKTCTLNLKRTVDGVEQWGINTFETMAYPSQFVKPSGATSTPITFDVGVKAKEPDPDPDPDPEPPIVNPTTSNHVYVMDAAAIEKMRRLQLTHVITDNGYQYEYDYSKYFIALMQFGFEIPESVIANDKGTVTLGNYNTEVQAPVLTVDLLTLSLGHVNIPAPKSSVDLEGVSYELVLPFIEDVIPIDAAYVGKSIRISYVIDLYHGDVTVNLYVEGEQVPFNSSSHRIGRNIPFENRATTVIDMSSINGVVNNTYSAYVRVTRPELSDVVDKAMVTVTDEIGKYSGGYVQSVLVEFESGIKAEEKGMLEDLLNEGVWIK